jgi:hypothetical protein
MNDIIEDEDFMKKILNAKGNKIKKFKNKSKNSIDKFGL